MNAFASAPDVKQKPAGRQANNGNVNASINRNTTSAQLTNCACGGGCPNCQAKSNDIKISQPADAAEIEADQIADKVMRIPTGDVTAVTTTEKYSSAMKRKCRSCKNEEVVIQRKPAASDANMPSQNPVHVSSVVSSGGRPLDNDTRRFFEPRMQRDFSSVRVHTNTLADRSSSALDAEAYTIGSHIVFANGRYAPHSSQGKHLLAHELTHVAQQSSAMPRIQRRPKKRESTAMDLIKSTVAYIGATLDEAKHNDYARSIVGDFVLSKNLIDFDYERKLKAETYKDSQLSTETYFIAVQQRPDGKDAIKPWSIIVDQHISFTLHGKFKGRYHSRDFARLDTEYKKSPAPAKLINANAYETNQPNTNVIFEAPNHFSTPVVGSNKPATTLVKRAKGNALFDFEASAKARVKALEALIPGFQPAKTQGSQAGLPAKHVPRRSPDHQPDRDKIIDDDDKQTVRTPTPAPLPIPADSQQDATVHEQDQTGKGEKKTIEVETETAAEKDDGGWLSGLLNALKGIAKGLGIFVAAVAAVVLIAFVLTGSLIALPVAAAIAGAFLLGYGLGTALRQRFSQDAYKGKPFAAIGRALLDTVGITGIQEAYTGKDAATGRKLTVEEMTERGTLGVFNLLTLLWGGLKERGGKAATPKMPTPIEPIPVPIEPLPTPVKPTPVPPEPVPVEPAPIPVEPAPIPIEPRPAPVKPTPVEPAPIEPSPEPVKPTPTPVEPGPVEPSPAPVKPTPAPVDPIPVEPSTTPIKPSAKNPKPTPKDAQDPIATAKEKSSRAPVKSRMSDAQQGLRDAIVRLKEAITQNRKNATEINKARIKAQADMLRKQQRVLGMERSDPARAQALKEFQNAKAKFDELQQQYDFRKSKLDELAERETQFKEALNNKNYQRPTKYNDGIRDAAWDSAPKQGNGSVKSPGGAEIMPGDANWVMGHKYGWEFWKHQVSAARRGITREQFLKEYNDSTKYRPETAADNGSRIFEAPDNINYWP